MLPQEEKSVKRPDAGYAQFQELMPVCHDHRAGHESLTLPRSRKLPFVLASFPPKA